MAHSAAKINAYARKLDQLRREAVAIPNDVRVAINNLTELHRVRIKDMIEQRIRAGEIPTGEFIPLQAQINVEINAMLDEARGLLNAEQEAVYRLATQKTRELAMEAGAGFYAPSVEQLLVAQKFGADLITNLSAETMQKVNGVLSKTALGGATPYDAMKEIDGVLGIKGAGGVSWRAETIVRTEVHRIYSVALDAQFEGFLQTGVDRTKVKKKWVSGPYRKGRREDHQAMDGKAVAYDDPFMLPNGNLLMFPGDPAGPAEEVINCGCTWVLVPESIEEAVLSRIENL